jgi:hypothetical protein
MRELLIEEGDELFRPTSPGQAAFLDDYAHRYVAYAGGWGAGKSWAGARKLANLHLYNAFEDLERGGGPTYCASLIVSPTYQMAQTINIPQVRAAFDEMGLAHRFVADPKVYAFVLPDLGTATRPSYVFVRSADAADKIAGFEVGTVWGDEAARWPCTAEDEDPLADPLIQSDGRLRHPGARFKQFNLTYTNEGQETRVYRDFEESPKPDHVLYRSSTRQNTHLPPDYVAALVSQLSQDLVDQYVEGHAAKLGANLVFGNFRPVENDDVSLVAVPGLPLQLSVDFNRVPGMHAVVGQHHQPQDLLTAFDELHRPGMLIKQMVAEFADRYGPGVARGDWPHVELFGDPYGNTGSMTDGETFWDDIRAELAARGIPYRTRVPSAHFGVADRVNATNSAFRSASGKVRYRINGQRCPRLLSDFKHLKWDGNKINKTVKERSHASEADTNRVIYLMPIRRIQAGAARAAVLPPAGNT